MNFSDILAMTFYGNSVEQWLIALLITIVAYVVLHLLIRVGLNQLQRVSSWTTSTKDDLVVEVLKQTNRLILAAVSIFIGLQWLTLPDVTARWLNAAVIILILIQVGIWGNALILAWAMSYRDEALDNQPGQFTTMQAVSFLGRLVLFSILIILALDNIPGVEVTTLLASLGIGGIAVALALQNILGDLFASLSIAFDKPFVIGDTIHVGEFVGTVEKVGLKTTRIRSLSGEQLVFSNADLLQSRLRNYKRMERRRVVFPVSVTYQTEPAKLKQIPETIRQIIDETEDVTFDRAHLKELGASSINFETVYYIESSDYPLYMTRQQQIILAVIEAFAADRIDFAYPTRTLLIDQWPKLESATTEQQEPADSLD